MFLRIGGRALRWSGKEFLSYLRGGSVDKKGEPKEEIEVIRGGFIFLNEGPREKTDADGFPWVFSSYDLDRFEERVDPAGWELGNYQKNPVVQWAHDHTIPAIGLAKGVQVENGSLKGTVFFNGREYDEFGWGIGERVRHGVIRAGSVGFLILKIELPEEKKGSEESASLIYRRQELLEFSICNVPANPFALAEKNERVGGGENGLAGLAREIGRLEKMIEDVGFGMMEDKLLDGKEEEGGEAEGFWKGVIRN
jgi:phage head maturation protease